jgi:hypothetical protein
MLERNGAPPDVVEAARRQANPQRDDFEVWADCWAAFEFFMALRGDWNVVSGLAVARVGIPSDRIESAMRLKPIPRAERPQMYADVKLMERAVIGADHELREKQKKE